MTAVVVGGGISGLASAVSLAQAGWRVTAVLTRRRSPRSWGCTASACTPSCIRLLGRLTASNW
ncbi:MAG TPA: FAD-dependent oxidoreductase [Streptosporangiaceae bacterium]